MRALLDESTPMVSGDLAYLVVATILINEDPREVEIAARAIVGERARPFHWTNEGPEARQRAIDCLIALGACAHAAVHHPTGRKRQGRARRAAIERLIPKLVEDGATSLLIESRGEREDVDDRVTLVGALKAHGAQQISYAWGDKQVPALWLADAACGAVAGYLTRSEPQWHGQLVTAGVVTEPIYLSGA